MRTLCSRSAISFALVVALAAGCRLSVSAASHHHHESASPSPSPEATASPIPYTTRAGTWELQLQPGKTTVYSHIFIDAEQADGTITARWLNGTTVTPLTGHTDAERFVLNGRNNNGPFTLSGSTEGDATMIGLFIQGSQHTPFTATHQGGMGNAHRSSHHHHTQHAHSAT